MKIYIEDLILINGLMYFSFLIIIFNLFKLKLSKFKLIFSSIFCGIFSLIFGSNFYNNFILFLLKIILTIFAITFTFKNLNFKKLIFSLILFFGINQIFTSVLLNFSTTIRGGIYINSRVPVFVILFTLVAISILARVTLNYIHKKLKMNTNIYNVELEYMGKKFRTTAYLDSGNNLELNSVPVSIIGFKAFNKITDIDLANFLTKKFNLKDQTYIDCHTITGKSRLLTFPIDSMKIYINKEIKTLSHPVLAVSLKLGKNNDYEILLNNLYKI